MKINPLEWLPRKQSDVREALTEPQAKLIVSQMLMVKPDVLNIFITAKAALEKGNRKEAEELLRQFSPKQLYALGIELLAIEKSQKDQASQIN